MEIAISFALALFLCTALVPVFMRYAASLGLVDAPDGDRKIHTQVIPRSGGIAIAIAVFVPAFMWLRDVSSLFGFFAGAAIIVVFGMLDDRKELSYKWKFFGQIIAVLVFLSGNVEITKTPFLGLGDYVHWLSYIVMAFFVLGVTNAVNLSDGLDGLAAGSSLLSLGFIAYLALVAGETSLLLIACATIGSLMGFLRYNTHPATVFMGDTGSQFLGYVTACLAILVTQSPTSAVSPILAISLVGIPILDTLMVMLLRLRDGRSPFSPDRRHLHHQFLGLGFKHYQAVAALYVLNFALMGLNYAVRFQSDEVVLLSYALFCAATLALIAFFKRSQWSLRAQAANERSGHVERRNQWLRRLHWVYVYGGLIVQCALGVIWVLAVMASPNIDPQLVQLMVVIAGIGVALFVWQGPSSRVVARYVMYSASVLALYIAYYQRIPTGWHDVIDISLLALVLFLALAIRMSRKEHFRLDTQDVLILMLLLAAPMLPLGDSRELIRIVVRLAVLLYAAEFVVGRLRAYGVVNILAMVFVAVITAKVLIGF